MRLHCLNSVYTASVFFRGIGCQRVGGRGATRGSGGERGQGGGCLGGERDEQRADLLRRLRLRLGAEPLEQHRYEEGERARELGSVGLGLCGDEP